MKLKLKDYRNSKDTVLEWYVKKGREGLQECCVISSIPLVAGCCYILEEQEAPELEELKENLIKFYGYTEIVE